jgi:hypothetical protein
MVRRILSVILSCLLPIIFVHADEPKQAAVFPKFEMQEIATDLGVGYAVLLVDVNGDGKKDIVVVDQKRVLWYENPTWKRRIIIENQTKPDSDLSGLVELKTHRSRWLRSACSTLLEPACCANCFA